MAIVTSPMTTCPRCEAPVKGDYKFCPTCAYRLKAGATSAPEPPPPARRLSRALLWAGTALLGGALALAGVYVFTDRDSIVPMRAPPGHLKSLTLENLADEMVEVGGGTAYYRKRQEDQEPRPVVTYKMECMKYEVTCGLYAEFLASIQERLSPVDEILRLLWRPTDAFSKDFSRGYVNFWWEAASARLNYLAERVVKRPPGLELPLSDEFGRLLLVPPAWVKLTNNRDEEDEIGWEMPEDSALLPVTGVSWYETLAFQAWAKDRAQEELRLPNDSEWVRIAHGNHPPDSAEPWNYPWGNLPSKYACNNSGWWLREDKPHVWEVDRIYPQSDDENYQDGRTVDGVYAMAGNVREWVLSVTSYEAHENVYLGVYEGTVDELVTTAVTYGGSFRDGIGDCTVLSQRREDKRVRKDDIGFRLVLTSKSLFR